MKQLPLVYVIGDSVSVQYGPSLERALFGFYRYDRKRGEAEALLNLDVPLGANGGDSVRCHEYLRAFLSNAEILPDVLLLNCGLHDIKRDIETHEIQVPLSLYRSNLEQIIRLCRDKGVLPVWIRTTPVVDAIHNSKPRIEFHRFASDVLTYNVCADEVMMSAHVPIIDLFTFTRNLGDDATLYCDHVHYREAIREKQGLFLAGFLAGVSASTFPPKPR